MEKITVDRLVKTYQGNRVINQISMDFDVGKSYGIVGRNGAGKSVFLKLLIGVLKPTEGTVILNGAGGAPLIGAVIDGCELFADLSAIQNLTYLANLRRAIGKEKIYETLRQVGLNPEDKRRIKKYSLGMKKRLLIAQAIMEDPDILVLDEPTNSLDAGGVDMLYKVVEDAKKRGTTVFVASHYKEDIETLCDVTYEMKEGQLQPLY